MILCEVVNGNTLDVCIQAKIVVCLFLYEFFIEIAVAIMRGGGGGGLCLFLCLCVCKGCCSFW